MSSPEPRISFGFILGVFLRVESTCFHCVLLNRWIDEAQTRLACLNEFDAEVGAPPAPLAKTVAKQLWSKESSCLSLHQAGVENV